MSKRTLSTIWNHIRTENLPPGRPGPGSAPPRAPLAVVPGAGVAVAREEQEGDEEAEVAPSTGMPLRGPWPWRPLDLRRLLYGRQVRFTNRIDAESEAFEAELLAQPVEGGGMLDLPLQQRHAWLRFSTREYRLLQVRDKAGKAALQAAIYVARPRRVGVYGQAHAFKLGKAAAGEEERVGLQIMKEVCAAGGDLLTLRLQPRRTEVRDLRDFEDRARLAGFTLCEPEAVTRTLIYDLQATPEQALAAMGQQLRRKFKAISKSPEVELRVLTDPAYGEACQAASAASVRRHAGHSRPLEWGTLFGVARERPDLVRILGLFLKSRPNQLLAFASACRHGSMAEYTSAGSLDDEELRKMPFNYWLLWELFQWSREQGSRFMDLGGVTVGGEGDPLAGISRFKRHISDVEVEVGREMIVTLRPAAHWAVETARAVREGIGELWRAVGR